MEDEIILKERKEKFISFVKEKYNWITYVILAIIIWISVYIRTLPMKINPSTGKPGLWDITRDNWTLGPDLDPFLFLRWAKYIVAHGSLMVSDTMRYIPLHYNTESELILLPYLIAWFHKVLLFFGGTSSVEYSAVIYPVFMFSLTIIAFFLLVRKLFIESLGPIKSNVIALISSLFLTILPSLLPRTIAGVPEKESTAFLFIFLSFYLFLYAWKSEKSFYSYLSAILAGASTAAAALVWGGYQYIVVTIAAAAFLSLLIGQLTKRRYVVYALWILSSIALMSPFSTRYAIGNLVSSTTSLLPIAVFALLILHFILFETKIKYFISSKVQLSKLPKPVLTIVAALVFGILILIILFGPSFITDKLKDVAAIMIVPTASRLGVTVAENKQPYFSEWAGSFGPSPPELINLLSQGTIKMSQSASQFLSNFPLFFWLFFFGSIYLFFIITKEFETKERIILTSSYLIFLVCLIFSRYSDTSILNGTNSFSIFVYALGFIVLIAAFGYYYYKSFTEGKEEKLRHFDFGVIILFILFFLSIVSARGSIRTVMVLVPSASIFVSYFVIASISDIWKSRKSFNNILIWVFVIFVIFATIFSGFYFYKVSVGTAASYIPSSYNQQWQKAMFWVRENTSQNAVFAHWWDYGYWIQTMGERSTVLDGGNSIVYWDYLMGRYALTGADNQAALNFLYSHDTTHLLIDSTDIGKYGAFSSIGSDTNYDRRSWISPFLRDSTKTQETKNTTIEIYMGGTPLDGDIVYKSNSSNDTSTKYLPAGNAGIAAVFVEYELNGSLANQPKGVFVYQGNQYILPLRYIYLNNEFHDYGAGVESGVFLTSRLVQDQNGMHIDKNGALLYLSNRTVKSQLARLYLYNEDNPNFKLVHSEDDFVVAQLKTQYRYDEDFIFYGDIRGPIRIWEINYPQGMTANPEFLKTDYPDVRLSIAK